MMPSGRREAKAETPDDVCEWLKSFANELGTEGSEWTIVEALEDTHDV